MNNFNQKITELSPTQRALLEQRLKQKAAHGNRETIPRITNRNSAPLSFSQTRMWFLNQLEPGNPAYNRPTNIHLKGFVNIAVLEQSLNEIVCRHEVLRTTFPVVDGQPVAAIAPKLTLTLPIVNLSSLSATEREAEAKRIAVQQAQQIFNLSQSPSFKATILRLSEVEHILLLTMHHIIFDGWSQGVLLQELAQIYEAFSLGKPSPLPELPIQYTDFAHWQRQQLQGEILQSQLAYWKKQLSGSLPVLELPTDRPRPAIQTFQGAKIVSVLPLDLSESLKALSLNEEVTLFMTLLATFQILLHRYTSQDDILVGSPIAGRNRIETEKLIGVLINTLVLRTHLEGKLSFRELLAQVREVALQAYAHQDIPFEKLVEELQPERNLSHTPLFQVMFQLRNLPNEVVEFSGIEIEEFEFDRGMAQVDLTLDILDTPTGLTCKFEYNTDLFDESTIERMAGHFQNLLSAIVENSQQNISSLSLVTPRAALLLPNPQQKLSVQSEATIHTKFFQQARRVPHSLAVVDAQVAWTYAELEALSNQLAWYLLANSIQSQDVVAIYGQRSALLIVAILGILKAGGSFVILEPAYPTSRLIDCLEPIQPRAWLQIASDSEVPTALREYVVSLCECCLEISDDSIIVALQSYPQSDPQVTVEPDNLAYVAFTSGSTGKPKGIKASHRPLSHFIQWHQTTFGLCSSDRFSMLSGLSHDPLLRDIFTPLSLGATLCIPQQKKIETLGELADWMRVMRISVAHLTPAMSQLLTVKASSCTTDLRYVFFAGDVLTPQDVEKICRFAPQVTCVNFYGATETPQAMGYFIIPKDCDVGSPVPSPYSLIPKTIPLGRGIEDVQLLILTHSLHLAGIGEIGEIYVRTPYLSSGYIDSDELTQERFLVNPFTKIATDRLYKTGDLGRYLPNGNIEFCHRIDNQVKIRGFRIELGEIETVLSQYPSVQEVVVLLREDIPGDKKLVAYVVLQEKQVSTAKELRQFLTEKLPEYMIPSAFVTLDTLPLTPNGKVDRGALPASDTSSFSVNNSFVEPRNPTEEVLAAIWAQVLGLEQIGIHDNFFELGGHSLLGMQLVSQASLAIGVEIPLKLLFEKQTIALLAQAIEALANSKQQLKIKAKISPLQRLNSQPENIPLSASQLWSCYNDHPYITTIKATYYIAGSLNVPVLEQSLNEIVRRHDILRTTFAIVDGKPVQVIAPKLILTVPVIDLRELSGTEKAHKSGQLFESESLRPFDLKCGPLIRTQLLHVGQQEYLLSFFINHIIFDGISLGVFMGELSVLYNAFDKGLPSPLAELPFQYADFVHWQQQYMSGEVREIYDSYWKQKLANAQPIFEPSRELGKLLPAFAHPFELSTNLINSLREMGRKESVSLFMIMLTAFKLLLHTYTGKDDIVVGVLNANRHPYETKFLIGIFANRLLLRTDLSGNPSFTELLVRVRDMYFESYEYQSFPDIQSGISEIDHAQVFFNFIPIPKNAFYSPFLQTKLVNLGALKVTEQDLRLTICDEEDRVHGKLTYTNRLFDAKTIEHLVNLYRQILEQAVKL